MAIRLQLEEEKAKEVAYHRNQYKEMREKRKADYEKIMKERSKQVHQDAIEIKKQSIIHSQIHNQIKQEVESINKFKRNQVFFNEGKIREKLYTR